MSTFKTKMKLLGGFLSFLRRGKRVSPAVFDITSAKNIVIINNKRLGDFLFCTPAIRAIHEANPSANITVVTSHQNTDLIGETPFINKVLLMGNSVKNAVTTGRTLRLLQPELGIIFHSKSPYDLIALTLAGTQCVMKHYFGNEKKVLLNVCDGYVFGGEKAPVQNDLALVAQLNVVSENKDMFYPAMIAPKTSESMSVGIQLGASGVDRYFPVEKAIQVIMKIHQALPECEFHLLGAGQEVSLGKMLTDGLSNECSSKVVNHIGKTTLHQLADIINDLSILITPDTGCLHIATALKTKTVSLFVKRETNASVPQQDSHLHTILYASDYIDEISTQSKSNKLDKIPAEVIENAVMGACFTK